MGHSVWSSMLIAWSGRTGVLSRVLVNGRDDYWSLVSRKFCFAKDTELTKQDDETAPSTAPKPWRPCRIASSGRRKELDPNNDHRSKQPRDLPILIDSKGCGIFHQKFMCCHEEHRRQAKDERSCLRAFEHCVRLSCRRIDVRGGRG